MARKLSSFQRLRACRGADGTFRARLARRLYHRTARVREEETVRKHLPAGLFVLVLSSPGGGGTLRVTRSIASGNGVGFQAFGN